jgi:hypothetical protein
MEFIPFTADPAQSFTVPLGDERFVLDVRYNEEGVWTLDLTRDSDGVQLLASVPLLLGQDVLSSYALGIGGIVLVDLDGTVTDAGPEDFSERVVALWLTESELDEQKAAGLSL